MSANELMDLADKQRLELTLRTREGIIRHLTQKGCLPDAPEDRDILLKTMDSMDRTVLTKAKIKSDDSANQSQAASAKLVAQVLMQTALAQRGTRVDPVTLDNDIQVVDMVEGETHIGVQTFKYDEIARPG